jgi:hypothetical protein
LLVSVTVAIAGNGYLTRFEIMRCPKCFSETPTNAHNCPSCNLPTPKGRLAGATQGKKGRKASARGKRVFDISKVVPGGRMMFWIAVAAFVGISGFLSYYYVYATDERVTPIPAINAMNQLRKLPSKEQGKTIEDCLNAEIKKSKEAGQLVGYQGWSIKPYERNSYLVSFTFDEKDAKKSAEWVVDPQNNIFTPINELATAVHKQESTN